jgi:hypothetical protein
MAQSLKHPMMRDPKTGKFERVTAVLKQIIPPSSVRTKNMSEFFTIFVVS